MRKYSTFTTHVSGETFQEVAGESHHYNEIWQLAKRNGGGTDKEVMLTAILLPEPNNKHDRNAIKVLIDNRHVGYIPGSDAAEYAQILGPIAAQGQLLAVPARLWWGTDWDGHFMASVRLDMPQAWELFPGNAQPVGAVKELPDGATMQVKASDDQMQIVAPIIESRSRVVVFLTVHRVQSESGRKPSTLVELRLDGKPVGTLSPVSSKNVLPVVEMCEQAGVTPFCKGNLSGNTLVAKLSVSIAKAPDVPEEWLHEVRATMRTRNVAIAPVESSGVAPIQLIARPPAPPPDWYPDPQIPGLLRYWDGSQWTVHTHPA